MKQDSIQELRAFDGKIFNLVQDYINHKEVYPDDSALAISPKSYDISIDSPSDTKKSEQYNLSTLIRKDEHGNPEPDCDATYDLASKYYFVR